MKFFLLPVIILISATAALAQTEPAPWASFGPEIGIPTGQAGNLYSITAGGSFKIEVPVAKSPFNFMASVGYNSFVLKGAYTGVVLHDAAYIPVEAGGRLYFSHMYIEGDVGGSFNINAGYTGPKVAFVYSPVIGFSTPSKDHRRSLDFGIKYEGRVEPGGTVSQVAVRVAFRVNMKKRAAITKDKS
jgi:hypothetical protein